MRLFNKKQVKHEKKPKRSRQLMNRLGLSSEDKKEKKGRGNSFYFHLNRDNKRRHTKEPLSRIRLRNRRKNKQARVSRKKNRA